MNINEKERRGGTKRCGFPDEDDTNREQGKRWSIEKPKGLVMQNRSEDQEENKDQGVKMRMKGIREEILGTWNAGSGKAE